MAEWGAAASGDSLTSVVTLIMDSVLPSRPWPLCFERRYDGVRRARRIGYIRRGLPSVKGKGKNLTLKETAARATIVQSIIQEESSLWFRHPDSLTAPFRSERAY